MEENETPRRAVETSIEMEENETPREYTSAQVTKRLEEKKDGGAEDKEEPPDPEAEENSKTKEKQKCGWPIHFKKKWKM